MDNNNTPTPVPENPTPPILESEPESKIHLYYIVLAGVVLVAVAGLIVWLLFFKSPDLTMQENFEENFQSGRSALLKNDSSGAIRPLERAIDSAETPEGRGQAQVNLGVAQLLQNPVTGIQYLKELSLDESTFPISRAWAINHILGYYNGLVDNTFASEQIFTGPKWGSFVQVNDFGVTDYQLAVKDAYLWSTEIFSTFVAEYRVALWYANSIVLGDSKDKEGDYDEALDRIVRGDRSIAFTGVPPSQIGLGHMTKGRALTALRAAQNKKLVARDDVSLEDILEAYTLATLVLENDPGDAQALGYAPYARFHKSIALLVNEAEDTDTKIIDALGPTYASILDTNSSFSIFLQNFQDESRHGGIMRNNIIRLAGIDPQFKESLLNIGWEEGDF